MVNRVLLTGAGFTHNFGTPLADGMWSWIFNDGEVQKNKKIRNLFANSFDFERIYQNAHTDKYSEEDKNIIHLATLNAYRKIDTILKNNTNQGEMKRNFFKQLLINNFIEKNDSPVSFFTLNQDLFFERSRDYLVELGSRVKCPCVEKMPAINNINDLGIDIGSIDICDKSFKQNKIEYENTLAKGKDKIAISYIKLHGSQNWLENKGNNQVMVIGSGKQEKIQNNFLLKYYFELFEKEINKEHTRILIIGYGFRDNHINKTLINAVQKNDLKIHVISPEAPINFKNKLLTIKNGKLLFEALSGYYENKFAEIFSENRAACKTPAWEQIEQNFFNE